VELGEKLKNARLEAGLSQRQLCGDTITRNMLSQIENGSAKPSYATLKILSSRLRKPVSYFLENAPSENLELLHRASQADPKDALAILEGYLKPDPMLDSWYSHLSARCRMALARQALAENRALRPQSFGSDRRIRFGGGTEKRTDSIAVRIGHGICRRIILPITG